MAIKFNCPNCRAILKAPDDSSGKKSRCAKCGNVQIVPSISAFSSQPEPDSEIVVAAIKTQDLIPNIHSPEQTHSVVEAIGTAGSFHGDTNNHTPGPTYLANTPSRKVVAPAVCMIVLNGIVCSIFGMAFTSYIIDILRGDFPQEDYFFVAIVGIWLALSGIVLLGSISMIQLRRYRFAKLGVILSFLVFPCFVITIIIGIWSLVVLSKPEVKRQFR